MGLRLQQEEIAALAAAVDIARISKGYTMDDLANMTGVNKGQISRFISGQFKTISTNLQLVCNSLDLDPNTYRPIGAQIPPCVLVEIERGWINSGAQRKKFEVALLALAKMFP